MKRIMSHGPSVKRELKRFLRQQRDGDTTSIAWRQDFLDRLTPFATSGKLLRGSLACFSYEAFSGKEADQGVLNAAVALELTQSALLIHDDVIDNDDLRRGQPSIHRQYQTAGGKEKLANPEQFGINMAICGGDTSLFLALELLAQVSSDPVIQKETQKLFAKQLVDTCAGQMQDVYLQARSAMPAKTEIYQVMEAKTAAYTLGLPLEMGAVLAGQPAAVRRGLRRLGATAGTIFQIRDDELGALGDSAKTGKPVGADIREGKKTLIYYYLMGACTSQERQKLNEIFGNPVCTANNITYAQRLIQRHRVPQLINQDIAKLERQAIRSMRLLELPDKLKIELRSLLSFCASRHS